MNEYSIVMPTGESIFVRNIYCIGRNYLDHISELNNDEPDEPFFFQKSLPALNTSNLIYLPEGREIHHELEIVIIIHKDCENIFSANATSYIGGYALGLDLTDRPFQNKLKDKKLPWLLSKSFKGSAVLSDFKNGPIDEEFWLVINGVEKQRGHINQMINSISEQIDYLSKKIPLLKGDLVFTGSPGGVGIISSGDTLKIGIGTKVVKTLDVQ